MLVRERCGARLDPTTPFNPVPPPRCPFSASQALPTTPEVSASSARRPPAARLTRGACADTHPTHRSAARTHSHQQDRGLSRSANAICVARRARLGGPELCAPSREEAGNRPIAAAATRLSRQILATAYAEPDLDGHVLVLLSPSPPPSTLPLPLVVRRSTSRPAAPLSSLASLVGPCPVYYRLV